MLSDDPNELADFPKLGYGVTIGKEKYANIVDPTQGIATNNTEKLLEENRIYYNEHGVPCSKEENAKSHSFQEICDTKGNKGFKIGRDSYFNYPRYVGQEENVSEYFLGPVTVNRFNLSSIDDQEKYADILSKIHGTFKDASAVELERKTEFYRGEYHVYIAYALIYYKQ